MEYKIAEEHHRRRLTDRDDIARAVAVFREHGCEESDLLQTMLALFYVDLDEFNEVVPRERRA